MGKIVVFAGLIGTGKTTIATVLSQHLGWNALYESVDDNPFLADFYTDPSRWAFSLQMYFLGHRAMQLNDAAQGQLPTLIDRSLYEDRLFVDLANELGHTSSREYETFTLMYDLIVSQSPRPDLLIYLEASPQAVYKRIQDRSRVIERSITNEYLDQLTVKYETWISQFESCPILRVDTEQMLFPFDGSTISRLAALIEARLLDG